MCELRTPVVRNLSSPCHLAGLTKDNFFPYTTISPPGAKDGPFFGVIKQLMDVYTEHYGECFDLRILDDTCSGKGKSQYVQQGKLDVLIGSLPVTYERFLVLDFSVIDRYGNAVAYRYPEVEPDIIGFIRPFSWKVWATLMIGLALILVLFSIFSGTKTNKGSAKLELPGLKKLNFGKPFIDAVGTLLGQADVKQAKTHIRLMKIDVGILTFVLWLVGAFILSIVYKSNLMAMLSARKLHFPFTTFEEMLAQKKVPYTILKGSLMDNYLKTVDKDSRLGRFNATMIPPVNVDNNMHATLVSKGDYALLASVRTIEGAFHNTYSKYGRCTLTYMKEHIIDGDNGIPFPKNSFLKPKFDKIITRLVEAGIMNHWLFDVAMPNASHCMNPPTMEAQELRPLNIDDMYGVMCLLLAGHVLSAMVLICEKMIWKLTKSVA